MNLLMITRKVDRRDSNAGFIFWFVEEIARQLGKGKLYVICLNKGDINGLPENLEVYSMGKEKGAGKLVRIIRGEWGIMRLIGKVDGVFTHMMPEYASLVGPWCKIFKKQLVHWYMHKAVNKNLKRIDKWVDEFVTATKLSFRMETDKPVNYVGHIIDTDKFRPIEHKNNKSIKQIKNVGAGLAPARGVDDKIAILSVSRISPSKDIETLIGAIEILQNSSVGAPLAGAQGGVDKLNLEVEVIGGPGLPEQEEYFEDLKKMVKDKNLDGVIKFLGPVPYGDLPQYYQKSDIFVNTSHTGSLDKTVLEAMASGCLPLTCNEAFEYLFKDKGLCFAKKDSKDLASKIMDLVEMPEDKKEVLRQELRREVVENHSLKKTVGKILKLYANNYK